MRTYEFITIHLEFLKGEIKFALNKLTHQGKNEHNISKHAIKKDSKVYVKKIKLEPKEEFTNGIFCDSDLYRKLERKRKRHKKRKKSFQFVVLTNGSRLAKQSGDKTIILRNTCAVDSVHMLSFRCSIRRRLPYK